MRIQKEGELDSQSRLLYDLHQALQSQTEQLQTQQIQMQQMGQQAMVQQQQKRQEQLVKQCWDRSTSTSPMEPPENIYRGSNASPPQSAKPASSHRQSKKAQEMAAEEKTKEAYVTHLERLIQHKDEELSRLQGQPPEAVPVAVQVGPTLTSANTQTDDGEGSVPTSPKLAQSGSAIALAKQASGSSIGSGGVTVQTLTSMTTSRPIRFRVVLPEPSSASQQQSVNPPPLVPAQQPHAVASQPPSQKEHLTPASVPELVQRWSDEPMEFEVDDAAEEPVLIRNSSFHSSPSGTPKHCTAPTRDGTFPTQNGNNGTPRGRQSFQPRGRFSTGPMPQFPPQGVPSPNGTGGAAARESWGHLRKRWVSRALREGEGSRQRMGEAAVTDGIDCF